MYTIDKDSRLEIAFMCSKSVLSPHLTFVEVGRRRFLRFPRTSSSLIQIFIECEQQNVATAVTVCAFFARLLREELLLAERKRGLSPPPHSLQSSFCLNPY